MKMRKFAEARYHRFYRLVCRDGICVYCGVPATTNDHFVPLSVLTMITDATTIISGMVLLPSCGECNSLASDRIFPTIASKRRYIHKKLAKRHAAVLAMPKWTEDELSDLGYALRDFVIKGQVQRDWLIQRLQWRNTSHREAVKLARVRFAA